MNAVVDHNQMVVDRARKAAGNLAHALKTELSKLQQGLPMRGKDEPVALASRRLAEIIDFHLARASAVAGGRPGSRADTADTARAVAGGLGRAFGYRGIRVDLDDRDPPPFGGERQDLEEILGNLIENAGKHARARVVAVVQGIGGEIEVRVEDDGPGLSADAREQAVRRGIRLDERGPGAGLGLAIVRDLVDLYGGTFSLDESELGGLKAVVRLPAVSRL